MKIHCQGFDRFEISTQKPAGDHEGSSTFQKVKGFRLDDYSAEDPDLRASD